MQTSNEYEKDVENPDNSESASTEPPAQKRKRRPLVALALIITFVIVDVLLTLALEPYGSYTELIWTEYRSTPNIDTVMAGTSTTAYGIKSQSLDETLGSNSFNMSTPGQSFDNTLSTLKTAFADHNIKRVIMFVGFETILEVPYINSSIIFTQSKCLGESPQEALTDVGNLLFYDYYFERHYSITALFPWAYDHVNLSVPDVADNIYNRLNCDVFEAGARYAQRSDPAWHYVGKGYGGHNAGLTQGSTHGDPVVHHADENILPSETTLASLERVCAYCKEQGVPLYIFAAPYTASSVLTYGQRYIDGMKLVKSMAQNNGAHYYDLNMLSRDVFNPSIDCFFDVVHLQEKGAELAGNTVGSLIKRVESGEDIQGLFYDYTPEGWKDYQASIDFVDTVDYETKPIDNGLAIQAIARTGTNTSVVYKFELFDPATQTWSVLRDYDPDPNYELVGNYGKSAEIRVYAKAAGAGADEERWSEGTITF